MSTPELEEAFNQLTAMLLAWRQEEPIARKVDFPHKVAVHAEGMCEVLRDAKFALWYVKLLNLPLITPPSVVVVALQPHWLLNGVQRRGGIDVWNAFFIAAMREAMRLEEEGTWRAERAMLLGGGEM